MNTIPCEVYGLLGTLTHNDVPSSVLGPGQVLTGGNDGLDKAVVVLQKTAGPILGS